MAYFPKRRRKRKGARRRRNQAALTVTPSPARTVIPSMKDVTQDLASGVVGIGAFVVSSVLGKGANMAFEKIDEMTGGAIGGAGVYVVGPAKFAARYLAARALRVYVFKESKGLMSRANGQLVQEIVLVSGVMALLNDLGLLDKIPVVGDYLPKLSGPSNITRMGISKYENYSGNMAGYKTWEGNRWSGRLRGYAQGGTLSGYARGGTLSKNLDNYRPNDHLKVPTYGVPAGA